MHMTGKAALLIVTLASSFVYKSIDLALNSSIFLAVLFYTLCMDKDPEAFIRDLLPLPSVTAAAATTTTTSSSFSPSSSSSRQLCWCMRRAWCCCCALSGRSG